MISAVCHASTQVEQLCSWPDTHHLFTNRGKPQGTLKQELAAQWLDFFPHAVLRYISPGSLTFSSEMWKQHLKDAQYVKTKDDGDSAKLQYSSLEVGTWVLLKCLRLSGWCCRVPGSPLRQITLEDVVSCLPAQKDFVPKCHRIPYVSATASSPSQHRWWSLETHSASPRVNAYN